jgi:adenylate cyclase
MLSMRATASDGAWQQLATSLVLSGVVILVLWAATYTRPWIAVDNKFFDLLTSLSAPYHSTLPVVILAIDEPSFAELKTQWPFPRRMHAQVLNRLRADGARAVGFDVVFAEASNPADDLALAQAIATAPPLVLGATRELTESGNATLWSEVAPLAAFVQAGAVPGQTLVRPDDDFVVRRLERSPDAFAMRVAIASGATLAAAPPSSEALIGYQGPRGTFDTRSYYQALEPGLLPEGFFRDKIVLIGRSVRTSTELRRSQADLFNSPFALVDQEDRLLPGIEVQANQLANLMLGDGIEPLDVRWQMALLVALSVLFVLLSSQLHPGMVAGMTAALATSVLVGTFWLFAVQKLWMPPLLPLLALVSLYGSTQLLHGLATRRRAQQIRAMFSQYVPADVVAQLIDNPALFKLGGEVRELTLMFTDLANFTAMSEHLSAPATVEVLTEYFNTMTDIIHRHGGTVDKFIGDAVMAFWGAPVPDAQHAEHAVRAAIDMQAAMHALTQRLLARGLPRIAMRIGLHSGKVVVGNVGSHRRFSYTAIGDAVNLAARLEGANKAFGSGILLSEATAAGLPAELSLRHLDTVVVKGKSQSIKVFSPCDDGVLRQLSASGIASFQQQQWETSASAFTQLLAYQPGDMAALRFLQRIEQLRATPPDATWQAALVLDKL